MSPQPQGKRQHSDIGVQEASFWPITILFPKVALYEVFRRWPYHAGIPSMIVRVARQKWPRSIESFRVPSIPQEA